MAELANVTRTKIAQVAGQKASGGSHNRVRELIIDTPAAWSAANGDTAGTELYIPMGGRLCAPVVLSNGAGAASSTISVGIRDARTKVAIDATAILAATAITSAGTQTLTTGTKVTGGQYYVMPQDVEVFLTFGGAAPQANQAIRIEIGYVAP